MAKILHLMIVFTVGLSLLFSHSSSFAATTPEIIKITTTSSLNSSAPADTLTQTNAETRESLFPSKSKSLSFSHFTWGAEIGSSLDLTSNDLSTFDVDVVLGFKNDFIKLVGVGAGIHRSIHVGNNLVPVYFVFRSSFRKKPSLLFFNLQAGYSFNSLAGSDKFGDWTGAVGLGINLKQTGMAKSYIILSAAYQHIDKASFENTPIDRQSIIFGRLVIGVNF